MHWTVTTYSTLDSTNDETRRLAKAGAREGLVVTADAQTAGRGRHGRSWHSPKSQNLYFSILLKPTVPAERLPSLTLAMGVAVAEVVEGIIFQSVQVKWPNDLIVDGRKLGGILTEWITESTVPAVIVGIGINVNMSRDALTPELQETATSLMIETNRTFKPDAVLKKILTGIEKWYSVFVEKGFIPVQRRYLELSYLEGKRVTVRTGSDTLTGIVDGIDDTGALLLRDADDSMPAAGDQRPATRVLAGDVNVVDY